MEHLRNDLSNYQNLINVFTYSKQLDEKGIRFIYGKDKERRITYNELHSLALRRLFSLQERGLKPGSALIFQFDDNYEFIVTFWACMHGGIVAIPITPGRNDEHRAKLVSVWKTMQGPKIIGFGSEIANIDKIADEVEISSEIIAKMKEGYIAVEELGLQEELGQVHGVEPDDLAFIQFSSGSTGEPKGVMLTHKNLLVNVNSIIHNSKASYSDHHLSWMPLTHDMGLIGWHLVPLFVSCDQTIMETDLFIRNPLAWMQKAYELKATLLASPNFGYRHFLKHFKPEKGEGWDLSHVRLIFNGAEPISADLCDEFLSAMAPYGIKQSTMFPAYGMAEACLGVSIPEPGEEFKRVSLDRNHLSVGDEVCYVEAGHENSVVFVDLGYPLIDVAIRICDDNNYPLPENQIGHIHIKGENVTQGYYNNLQATIKALTEDGWLNTGDLGFLRAGRLVVTGRAKDVIFVNGQNYYPSDIEHVAEEVDGVELNKIIVCGVTDLKDQNEKILACVLSRKNIDDFIELASNLKRHILEKIGIELSYVVPVKRIPKTTSGKLQRYKMVESYVNGEFDEVIAQMDAKMQETMLLREIDLPTNPVEEKLTELISSYLQLDKLGINDNLMQFGLNSLKASMLMFAIQNEFGVEIPISKVFTYPTVKELAQLITVSEKSEFTSIKPVELREYYPVSSAQKRIFSANQFGEGQIGYNLPFMLVFEGELDVQRFKQSVQKLVERHESLRTSFGLVQGKPVQRVLAKVDFTLPYIESSADELDSLITEFVRPFTLGTAPLFRAQLVKYGDKHLFMCDLHHIIADASSIQILLNELSLIYQGKELAEVPIQYRDYTLWHTEHLQNSANQLSGQFWREMFADEVPQLNLPTDYRRPAVMSNSGDRYHFQLDAKLTENLYKLAEANNATIYMVLYSLTSILLGKYSGQEDLILGVSVPGRSHQEVQNLCGMFANILAVRNKPAGRKSYADYLEETRERLLKVYEHQDYQFDQLVADLNLPLSLNRNLLVDTVFVLQNVSIPENFAEGLKCYDYGYSKKASVYDITFNVIEDKQGLKFDWEYNTDLFTPGTMKRLGDSFIALCKKIGVNPKTLLCELDILAAEERMRLLTEFNNTWTSFNQAQTLHQLFEEQVCRTPECVAVSDGVNSLTYADLNNQANQVARMLRSYGCGSNQVVGLLHDRTVNMLVGILGILKAGSAYLPISSDYPAARVAFMLKNSEASVLLTQKCLSAHYQLPDVRIVSIEDVLQDGLQTTLESVNHPSDLAYVIYTSGSTGNPKGVMIEHHSVTNLIEGLKQAVYTHYESPLRIALVASYIFDASVQQIFVSLLLGHSLYIVPEETRKDGAGLIEFYSKHQIDISDGTPTHINLMNLAMADTRIEMPVRHFIIGGEALYQKEVKEFLQHLNSTPEITNVYGPTECCVDTTAYKVVQGQLVDTGTVPIGAPLANMRIYILGNNLELLPTGAVGELYISGQGLARGYLSNPQMTAERFIPNPYEPGQKMYKTGDLGRWLSDGNIEYIGRVDYQVKIRGFRIELGEIEAKLLQHKAVQKAVVIDKEGLHGKYLVAYVVLQSSVEEHELKSYLSAELPEYMVPARFISIAELPLTLSGKVNRKALPEPLAEVAVALEEVVAPVDIIEEKLIGIWKEVLGVKQVRVTDDFFDLNGHSLNARILANRIEQDFHVKMPLQVIFRQKILSKLATFIREAKRKDDYSSIERVPQKDYYPVTSAQKRLYVISESRENSLNYNAPVLRIVEGPLDVTRLSKAFYELVERHDSLRTSFEVVEGEIVQRVHPQVDFTVKIYRIEENEIPEVVNRFICPFDLRKAPLLKVEIAQFGDKHLFMLDIHHIVSDAVSMDIILGELNDLYIGHRLGEPKIQYKDFTIWQSHRLRSEKIKEQEAYWIERFKGETPVLELPTDYPRPAINTFEGDQLEFALDNQLSAGLNTLSSANGTTLFMTLLSGFNLLLAKYTGAEDIVVGSPIAGRPHADLAKLVGFFVNMLPIRNHLTPTATFKQLLAEVKENALNAYENQEYQFELLIDKLGLGKDNSRSPLFDVVFALQNTSGAYLYGGADIPFAGGELTLKPYLLKNTISKFDITVVAYEADGQICFKLEYSTQLFKRESMERFAQHYRNLLKRIVENPEATLEEIDMLSAQEKELILHGFNNTELSYEHEKTISELFAEQVAKSANLPAVYADSTTLTYAELSHKVNQLAQTLREKGVKSGDIVGLMVERTHALVIGILGILQAGGAYLPIDPEYPLGRIEYMIKDSGSKLLVTQSYLRGKVPRLQEVIDVDEVTAQTGDKITILPNVNQPTDLAYVIYTSGSTGNPKGVMIEHRSVNNLIAGLHDKIYSEYGKGLRVALVAPYIFDASVQQIFAALLLGHTLYVVPEDVRKDGAGLVQFYHQHQIQISDGTPTHVSLIANALLDGIASLPVQHFIIGGEALHQNEVRNLLGKFSNYAPRITNVYGPTECCVDATAYAVDPLDELIVAPIGKPLANVQIYILDDHLELLPVGVEGEIYIAGEGLARGYLANPQLTEERFIANPFKPQEKMYKTGDLGKWLPDGNIEFMGRVDYQVKIRGFRIELGEIEHRLLSYSGIKQAVVIDRIDGRGFKYLAGYLVADREINESELKEHLQHYLPEYMVPAHLIQLVELPLKSNGKIDRAALPEPQPEALVDSSIEQPKGVIEVKLAEIWQEVLGLPKVKRTEDFFEVGGHSLNATLLISKINKEFGVKFPLREVFKLRTLEEMAKYIRNAERKAYMTIPKAPANEYYEVSSAQKRIYTLAQLDPDGIAYNAPLVTVIKGEVDLVLFEQAFLSLIGRHEALRTSFEVQEKAVVQRIHDKVEFSLEYIEVDDTEISQMVANFIRPFDLSSAPLLRVGLGKCQDKYIFMLDMHHIISDGVSMDILYKELLDLYEGKELPEIQIQYKDFALWQNRLLKSDFMKEQEQYWLNKFSGELPVLNLPTDYPRPAVMGFEGDSVKFAIDPELFEDLGKLALEQDVTLFMILLAALKVFLAKYTHQDDLIIGTPVAGRTHAELQHTIGSFINTLALRTQPDTDKTFTTYLQEVKQTAIEAYENQDYQFDQLIDELKLERNLSRNPLFDVMCVLQNANDFTIFEEAGRSLQIGVYDYDYKISKFSLVLVAYELEGRLHFRLDYSTVLFKPETAVKIAEYFVNVLRSVLVNPQMPLAEVQLISAEERQRWLYEWNQTRAEYAHQKTIHQLFEEQVARTPDNLAAVFGEQALSYRELNARANQLARRLRQEGVNFDEIVGILADRSLEMLISIFAVLKAGGAYLPIDPEYPEERINYVLTDSNAKLILTQKHLCSLGNVTCKMLDIEDQGLYTGDSSNLENVNNPTDLIYVIYTSGSTGKPKGTMIEHRGVVNYITWAMKMYLQGEQCDFPLYSSLAFDLTVTSIYVPLLSGNKLVIYGQDDKELLITRIVQENQVQIVKLTPAHLRVIEGMNLSASSIKRLIVGGEALKTELAAAIHAGFGGNVEIYNEYGPTETVVGCMIYRYNPLTDTGVSVPIGVPADNVQIYLLDENMEPVGVGESGQIYIAGDGVARGYLQRVELTKEKFRANPFEPGTRMYATGDLAKMLPDGNVEFLGRIDQQVKVRGYRIELQEIEHQLAGCQGVEDVVVIDRTDSTGETELCAYLVCTEGSLSSDEIKTYLKTRLPEYMLPQYFIFIEQIPLTPNGKINRRALPEPLGVTNEGLIAAPRNAVEAQLLKIWEEVLGHQLGIHDNFFEHGGHSIKATQLVAWINQEMNVELSLMEVFTRPTVAELAEVVQQSTATMYQSIEPIAEREYYDVSAAQQRIYTLAMLDQDEIAYNTPIVMHMESELDVAKVEAVFSTLIGRHEALRTSFVLVDGRVQQKIESEVEFALECYETVEVDVESLIAKFIRPFDLKKAPLLRVGLIKVEHRYLMMLDLHHIIADAVSMKILFTEFDALYEGQELPPLRIQYKDFAEWQNNLFSSDRLRDEEEYWLNEFSGEVPVLDLPTDYQRPAVLSFAGDSIWFSLDSQLSEAVKELSAAGDATLFMTLLAAFNVLLNKYSGQDDIIVGSPIAGRQHADLQNVIGMFVNTIALRNYPVRDKSFAQFLQEVKERALNAYDNQDYQFDMLVDRLNLVRDTSRNPLFDVMLVMQNATDVENYLENSALQMKPYDFEYKIAKFNLVLVAYEMNGQINFKFDYSTLLFKRETALKMAQYFTQILETVTRTPEIHLAQIQLLSEEERTHWLYEFNKTDADYPKTQTIHQLFANQAALFPDETAVIFNGSKLTYRELDARSNQLAQELRANGVEREALVGIMADRSLEMVMGILAISKAGAAFLPIDPEYPEARIEYMLKDSGTEVVLTDSQRKGQLKFAGKAVLLDDPEIYLREACALEDTCTPENLAYVIYTSGSTGNPKGTLIEHRGVVNYITWAQKVYLQGERANFPLYSSLSFDLTITSLFVPLLSGNTIVVYGESKTGLLISDILAEDQVEIIKLTPAHLKAILEMELKPTRLKRLIVGGENLSTDLASRIHRKFHGKVEIYNEYGPTETVVGCMIHRYSPEQDQGVAVPIGRPADNVQIYLLDENHEPCGVGIPGELYISGDGVARGYLNKPELTAEKFLPNPFVEGKWMYRTGDLAKRLTEGNIEFLGRLDHQVKIRGFRIELGEIEKQLMAHAAIREAVVIDKKDHEGESYLSAYLISEGQEVSAAELKTYLAGLLPEYMVPLHYVFIEQMPLTANGKLDRKALPDPMFSAIEVVGPRNRVEAKLFAIWEEVLGKEVTSVDANFFELGGHSLKATQLAARVSREFNAEISLLAIFERPTIAGLAEMIQDARESIYSSIARVPEADHYPLSRAQMRVFITSQMEDVGITYNMPIVLEVTGELDYDRLAKAFQSLVNRHEAFRTTFTLAGGVPVQQIQQNVTLPIIYTEITEADIEKYLEKFIRPFDLTQAPLLRVELLKVEDRHLLLIDTHHIVADGISINIIFEEFIALYNGQELDELLLQYKDFAVWQNDLLESEYIAEQERYWVELFAESVSTPGLQTDYPRSTELSFTGDVQYFSVDLELTEKLNILAKETASTLFMVLLAAYDVLLARISGEKEVVVGTAVLGRPHADLEKIVGMFINLLPLRSNPDKELTFSQFLQQVKEQTLETFDNQDYPYELLLDKLNVVRDVSRNPLFDTVFHMQNQANAGISQYSNGELTFTVRSTALKIAKFDLRIDAVETLNGLSLAAEYRTELFHRETIEHLMQSYIRILHQISENKDIVLKELSLSGIEDLENTMVDELEEGFDF